LERWNIYIGDSLKELTKIKSESVQTVVTSPPYWGLRDYGTADWEGGNIDCKHKPVFKPCPSATVGNDIKDIGKLYYADICKDCGAKRIDSQIGIESSPQEYIQNMVNLFKEVKRVLKKDGTVWLNLGDSYVGGGKGEWSKDGSLQKNHIKAGVKYGKPTGKIAGLKTKDLVGIPWRVALALQEDGWWLRSDIIWHKPNPMPESVTDRPTKSHEYIFLLTKSPHYYYDQDAIREPVSDVSIKRSTYAFNTDRPSAGDGVHMEKMGERFVSTDGRNKRSVWSVTTQPYKESHFATYPEKLVTTCILAGTSEHGECPDCGKAWIRIVNSERISRTDLPKNDSRYRPANYEGAYGEINGKGDAGYTMRTSLGWQPGCNHKTDPVPQIVLDPFSGAGTTGVVACKLNRIYIGVELNPEYAELSKNRLAKTVGATLNQSMEMSSKAVQGSLLLYEEKKEEEYKDKFRNSTGYINNNSYNNGRTVN
jgi:DNA modification methylase